VRALTSVTHNTLRSCADNPRQRGLCHHGLCSLHPTQSPGKEVSTSNEMGRPRVAGKLQTRKKHELCLRKGLLCLSGTLYHRLEPRDQETKMAAGSHLALRQEGFLQGSKSGRGTEAVLREKRGGRQGERACVRGQTSFKKHLAV
jgi:hypothetical protein